MGTLQEEIQKLEHETIRSLNERIAEQAARLTAHQDDARVLRESLTVLEGQLALKSTAAAALEVRVGELTVSLNDMENKMT